MLSCFDVTVLTTTTIALMIIIIIITSINIIIFKSKWKEKTSTIEIIKLLLFAISYVRSEWRIIVSYKIIAKRCLTVNIHVTIVVEKFSVVKHRDLYILQWKISLRVGLTMLMATSEHSHRTVDSSSICLSGASGSVPVVLKRRFVIGAYSRAPPVMDRPT